MVPPLRFPDLVAELEAYGPSRPPLSSTFDTVVYHGNIIGYLIYLPTYLPTTTTWLVAGLVT